MITIIINRGCGDDAATDGSEREWTTDLETRIARWRNGRIQVLGILYGYVMDERDEDGIRRIFCEDATLRSQDGSSRPPAWTRS